MSTTKLKENTIKVPNKVVEQLGLKEGDEFDIDVEDDAIVLRPHETDELVRSPEIDTLIEEGLADVRAGRVTPAFADSDELERYRKTEEYRKFLQAKAE